MHRSNFMKDIRINKLDVESLGKMCMSSSLLWNYWPIHINIRMVSMFSLFFSLTFKILKILELSYWMLTSFEFNSPRCTLPFQHLSRCRAPIFKTYFFSILKGKHYNLWRTTSTQRETIEIWWRSMLTLVTYFRLSDEDNFDVFQEVWKSFVI